MQIDQALQNGDVLLENQNGLLSAKKAIFKASTGAAKCPSKWRKSARGGNSPPPAPSTRLRLEKWP